MPLSLLFRLETQVLFSLCSNSAEKSAPNGEFSLFAQFAEFFSQRSFLCALHPVFFYHFDGVSTSRQLLARVQEILKSFLPISSLPIMMQIICKIHFEESYIAGTFEQNNAVGRQAHLLLGRWGWIDIGLVDTGT